MKGSFIHGKKQTGGGVLALPRRLLVHLLLRLSPKVIIEGFEVSALNESLTTRLLSQLQSALELIKHVDPRIFQRLHRDIKRIMLVSVGGPEYWPFANGLIVNADVVEGSDSEFVALTIVHEGTHARLWKSGIRYTPELRERIERVCVRAELAFVSRLPDSAFWVDHVTQKLAMPWWTSAQISQRQVRAREALWPRWLVRLHGKLFTRRDDHG